MASALDQSDYDYGDPLKMLTECHRRIEYFLDNLLRIASAGRALTPRQWESVERATIYLESAAPWHIADEEMSLFPRLRVVVGTSAGWSLDLLTDLRDEESVIEGHHEMLNILCRRWLDHTRLSEADAQELIDRLEELQTIYQRHFAIEERMLFPLAARTLSSRQLHEIGSEMTERRTTMASSAHV